MNPTRHSPLVTPAWLKDHLDDDRIVILDASFFLPNQQRSAREEYRRTHIPGASFFNIDEVADHDSSLPHMLPSPDQFARAASAIGIGNDTHVVTYDSNCFMASARLWWTFRVFGHDRVSVLDGGLERWNAEGRPLSDEATPASPRNFAPVFRPELVRSLDQVKSLLTGENTQLLDARSPGRFAGSEPEPRAGLRSGHIPGSRNLFFKELIDGATCGLKPLSDLESLYRNAGIDVREPVVTTCGTGVTAAILALGLYCLGNEKVSVYDGSWTEWGGRADTPVATS